MNETIKAMITMALLCAAAGFAVVFFHTSTVQSRQKQTPIGLRQAAASVYTPGVFISDSQTNTPGARQCWVGKKDSAVAGYAFLVETQTPAGRMSAVVGLDTGGIITGVVILSENETPSMSGRLEEVDSKKTIWNGLFSKPPRAKPWFTEQVKGICASKPIVLSADGQWPQLSEKDKRDLLDKNAISAMSGATDASRALIRVIEKAGAALAALRERRQ